MTKYTRIPSPIMDERDFVKHVVNQLESFMDDYGFVSVEMLLTALRLFDSTIPEATYEDTKWGWTADHWQLKIKAELRKGWSGIPHVLYKFSLQKPKRLEL